MFRWWLRHRKITVTAVVTAVLLVIGAGTFVWLKRQANRRQFLLALAAEAESAQDWMGVEAALRRYITVAGEDAQTCARTGDAIVSGAADGQDQRRALPFYAKAVSLDPENDHVRLRFADLMLLDNPAEALRSSELVLGRQPDQPEAWRIRAMAMVRMLPASAPASGRLLEIYEVLQRALGYQPGHLELASQVAEFAYRHAARLASGLETERAEIEFRALAVLDGLVEHAEDEGEARLIRVLFRRRVPNLGTDDPVVSEDLQRLVELRPASNVVRLLAAGWAARKAFPAGSASAAPDPQSLAEARSHLEAAMQNRSEDPLPYWSLAQLQWWAGEREAAVQTLQQGQQATGEENLILNLRLAELQMAASRWADAKKTLEILDGLVAPIEPPPEPPAAPAPSGEPVPPGVPAPPSIPKLPSVPVPPGVPDAEASAAGPATPVPNDTTVPVDLRPVIDLLWAQWWLGAGNPAADPSRALPLLDRYAEDVMRPGLRGLAVYLRGLAYASLGRWNDSSKVFARGAQIVDATVLPRLGLAYSLYRIGRYREALTQYRHVLALLEQGRSEVLNEGQIWIEVAHCAIAEQSQRATAKQDWRAFREALDQLNRRLPDSPIPLFLELEAARWNADPRVRADAEARLSDAELAFGEVPEYWALLASYRLRNGDSQGALTAIGTWEQKTGQRALGFRAELALADGDPDAADELLQTTAESLAGHQQRQNLSQRVQLALQFGRIDRARQLLDQWLERHPDDVLAQFELVQVAWSVGDVPTMLKTAEALLELGGDADRLGRIARTQALLLAAASGDDKTTREELRQASSDLVARFPDDLQVRVLQGFAAETLGEPREAIRAWRQAVEWGEQNPGVLLRLASLLHREGQSREGLELCITLSAASNDCRAASLAASILRTAMVSPHEQAQAEDVFRAILAEGSRPDLSLFLVNLSILREHQGRPDDAIALTRKALQQFPKAVELKNNLAWFLSAYQKDHQTALTLIEDAIAAVGPVPALLDTQGVILLALGRTDDAVRVLETSVQGDDVPAALLLHLAEAYHQAGRNDEARSTLAEAESRGLVNLSPRDRHAHVRLKAKL